MKKNSSRSRNRGPQGKSAPRRSAPRAAKPRKKTQAAARPAKPSADSPKQESPPEPGRRAAAAPGPARIPPMLLEGDEPSLESAKGPGQRYAVGRTALATEPEAGFRDMPESYATGRLLLMARDPRCLYAHWDLTSERMREFCGRSAHGHLVVRVYQGWIGNGIAAETHVHPESRHWFVHVDKPNSVFIAQLGYYEAGGLWVAVASSDAVMTPPDAAAEDKTAVFVTIRPDQPLTSLPPTPASSPDQPTSLGTAGPQPDQESNSPAPPIRPALASGKVFPPRIARVWPHPAARSGHAEQAESSPNAAAATPAFTPAPNWSQDQERALDEIIRLSMAHREFVSSIEISGLIERELRGEAAAHAEISPEAESITSPGGPAAPRAEDSGSTSMPNLSSMALPNPARSSWLADARWGSARTAPSAFDSRFRTGFTHWP